jgi:hypothetical protein
VIEWYLSHASQYGRNELRFRAVAPDGSTIAESPTFKGNASFGPNQQVDDHRQALADLLDQLPSKGWRAADEPPAPWYAWRLRRNAQ